MLQLNSSKTNPSKDKENQLKGTYTPLLLLSPTTRQKPSGWRRHSDNPFSPSSSKTAATTNTIADHILLAANLPLLFPSAAESSEDVAIILSDVDELRKKRKKSAAAGTSQEGNMLGRSRQRSRSMERVSKI